MDQRQHAYLNTIDATGQRALSHLQCRVHRSIGVPNKIQHKKSIRQVRNLISEVGIPTYSKLRDLWGGRAQGQELMSTLPYLSPLKKKLGRFPKGILS